MNATLFRKGRLFILPVLLALGAVTQPVRAEGTADTPSAQQSPGPGKSLPKNSKEFRPPDLTGLRQRAADLSDVISGQARDLVTFLAILALIYTGYHAQFRGLEEFVATLLRMVMAFALIASYREMLPYFFDARRQLIGSLPVNGVEAVCQVGTMIGTIGIGTVLMGPAGIGLAVAIFVVALLVLLVYSAQILFEALLVALGPLAIACLAFRHSAGIFTAWFKTFLAAILIPVGWTIGLFLGANLFGWNGESLAETGADFVAYLIYTAAAGAIYLGMPILTVWLVNKASGAAAAAMPSPLQLFSAYFAGRAAVPRNAGGTTTGITQSISSSSLGTLSPGLTVATGGGTTTTFADPYTERIRNAQRHHGGSQGQTPQT